MGGKRQSENPLRNRLALIRTLAGLHQGDLADRSGVSRWTIETTERGVSVPTVAVALRLCGVLGVAVEDVFQLADGGQPDEQWQYAEPRMEVTGPELELLTFLAGWRKKHRDWLTSEPAPTPPEVTP